MPPKNASSLERGPYPSPQPLVPNTWRDGYSHYPSPFPGGPSGSQYLAPTGVGNNVLGHSSYNNPPNSVHHSPHGFTIGETQAERDKKTLRFWQGRTEDAITYFVYLVGLVCTERFNPPHTPQLKWYVVRLLERVRRNITVIIWANVYLARALKHKGSDSSSLLNKFHDAGIHVTAAAAMMLGDQMSQENSYDARAWSQACTEVGQWALSPDYWSVAYSLGDQNHYQKALETYTEHISQQPKLAKRIASTNWDLQMAMNNDIKVEEPHINAIWTAYKKIGFYCPC